MMRVKLAAAIVIGVLLTTWPMPLAPRTTGLGLPGLEGPDHLWALWAGLQDGPVVIDTTLVNFPAGMRWVLVDPLNLLWFSPGWLLGGPGLGWNLVMVGSLVVVGLAAAWWCRLLAPEDEDAPAVAALAAITAAPVAGSMLTGMSEAMTMGWLVLALAALYRLSTHRGWRDVVLAGLLLGLTAWAGPYTAIYTALAAVPVLVAVLWRQRAAALSRLGLAGGLAGLISLPILRAVLIERPEGLPGSDSGLPAVLAEPGAAKNLMLGADPLGLVWPTVPIEPLHAVFMGSMLALLSLGGLRRAAVPAAAALLLAVLGLGFFLQRDGALWGAVPLSLPATWLSALIEPLGRAIRWHRAIIPATILLSVPAALTAAALCRRAGRFRVPLLAVLCTALAAEALLRAPLPWPRRTFDVAPPDGYAMLSEGPVLPLPLVRFSSGGPDQLRSSLLLWQTSHGHPIGGNPRQPGTSGRDPAVEAAATALMGGSRDSLDSLAALGFSWVVIQDDRDRARLQATLGTPDVDADGFWAWSTTETAP